MFIEDVTVLRIFILVLGACVFYLLHRLNEAVETIKEDQKLMEKQDSMLELMKARIMFLESDLYKNMIKEGRA